MEVRTRRDRILLSDAVVAALLSAGATTEMIDAAQAAARVEYQARRVKERPKEAVWKRPHGTLSRMGPCPTWDVVFTLSHLDVVFTLSRRDV
jgi:hypothetical protein